MIKGRILRWEIIPDYPGVASVITKVPMRGQKGQLDGGNMHISLGRKHIKNLRFQPEIVYKTLPTPTSPSESGGHLLPAGTGPLMEPSGDIGEETEYKGTEVKEARQDLLHAAALGQALFHYLLP